MDCESCRIDILIRDRLLFWNVIYYNPQKEIVRLLFMQAYSLTGEKQYIGEAKKAV